MPNWNDSSDIAKYLKAHPDTVVVERRKPSEKPKPQLKLKDLKPAPKENAWRRNWEEAKPPPKEIRQEVRPESSYEVYDRDPDRETPWQRKEDLPNPQGGYRTGMEEITPYTNYQALPEFVTSQRRNPSGGYAGYREHPDAVNIDIPNAVVFGNGPGGRRSRGLPSQGTYLEGPQGQLASTSPVGYDDAFINTQNMDVLENPPWGYGPAIIEYQPQYPQWRPANDLWRRIAEADIVPGVATYAPHERVGNTQGRLLYPGQNVPLGQQMRPSLGPQPYSDYFNLSKYGFTEA
jgi:hypothetical protein